MSEVERIRTRVLSGLAADREPGFSFTGHFLATEWPQVSGSDTRVTIPFGPHCADGDGRLDLTALLMTFDSALATPTRLFIEPGERLATAHLHVQFTGAHGAGMLTSTTACLGRSEGDAVGQLLARGSAAIGGDVVCHGSGVFVRLPPPPGGRELAPLPWQRDHYRAPPPLEESELDARERTILAACDAALAAGGGREFLAHFWGLRPEAEPDGARCRIAPGPHMANRVGHVQGGILLGLAAATARAALPRHTVFSSLAAWFISPGQGEALECSARVVHAGRSFAVVRTEILGPGGVRVLEAMTSHAAPP